MTRRMMNDTRTEANNIQISLVDPKRTKSNLCDRKSKKERNKIEEIENI